MTPKEIYCKALDTYGAEAQTLMVFEEMSELQKELCKHARGKDNKFSIAEEIADVEIMLEQMKILHDVEDVVANYKIEKLFRLERRLEYGMKNHQAVGSCEGCIYDGRHASVYPCSECYRLYDGGRDMFIPCGRKDGNNAES